jgi:hypothetical protein
MRLVAIALVAVLAPSAAHAQLAPRSLAIELGFSEDAAPALASRASVGLAASWWVTGDLDVTARLSWAAAARTEGRAADPVYEAGLGLRRRLARGSSLRPYLAFELAAVGVLAGAVSMGDTGLRLGIGAGVEAFLGRDLFLAAGVQGSELLFLPGGGGLGGCWAVRAGAYF